MLEFSCSENNFSRIDLMILGLVLVDEPSIKEIIIHVQNEIYRYKAILFNEYWVFVTE